MLRKLNFQCLVPGNLRLKIWRGISYVYSRIEHCFMNLKSPCLGVSEAEEAAESKALKWENLGKRALPRHSCLVSDPPKGSVIEPSWSGIGRKPTKV